MDEEELQSTLAKIHSGIVPGAIELAYIYSLLAICAIALPSSRIYKAKGQILEKENVLIFMQEVIMLMRHATNHTKYFEINNTNILLECRVYNALAWVSMYSQHPKSAIL